MTTEELGKRVKAKYPQYANVPDSELGYRVASKHPEYRKQISSKPSMFERFGKALPIAGSVAGGLAGSGAGTVFGLGVGAAPGAFGGATLGGAAGEAARQIIGRALGEKSPQTSAEAAKEIGIEGALSAAGEGSGRVVGAVAKGAYKAFPKFAHGVSGTPAVNIARAQQRGFRVFKPEKGISNLGTGREATGKAKGRVEQEIIQKLFSPKEQVRLKAKDADFADELMKSVMLKQITKQPITAKEAVGLRILAPVKRAADTQRGIGKNIELDAATRGARATIAEKFPELASALAKNEKAITASQLRKPFIVNKTNPDQMNKLFAFLGTTGAFLNPKALAALFLGSPLSMGTAGAAMGQVKKSIPKSVRRGIQRTGTQSLARVFGEDL